jgi:rhodanese-related sulfurtransferase
MKSLITGIFALTVLVGFSACSTAEEPAVNEKGGATQEQQQSASIKQLAATDFEKVKSENNAIVIDVRTPDEVAEGYIDGATKFIDVNSADFSSEIAKLDKGQTYIVYCRSGARSMRASEMMIHQGFTRVYNLQGGIMGWTGKIIK